MKKLFLLGAFALFGAMNAQSGFKIGANVGLPLGDADKVYSFVAGVDASYLWPVAADFNLGLASGAQMWFGKKNADIPGYGKVETDNSLTVPVAVSGQYRFTPEFSLGADLGYSFATEDGAKGGFYYAPKAAYHFGPSEVNLSYRGVSRDGGTLGSVNLGYAYSFGK